MIRTLEFLTRYNNKSDKFFTQIMTGDKTWVAYETVESKRQSMEWKHSSSPAIVKPKQILTPRKVMCIVFWDGQGILMIDFFVKQLTAMFTARLFRNLGKHYRTRAEACSFLTRPHTANVTTNLLRDFGWDMYCSITLLTAQTLLLAISTSS